MKRAFIFGGGEYGDAFPTFTSDDLIIAADSGYDILKAHSIKPMLTIGDFDSAKTKPENNVIVLPVEKDITDSHAAMNKAIENNCDEIYFYGSLGGRPDHSFANYTLLAYLSKKGIRAFCIGKDYKVTAITDGKIILNGEINKTVSVFSWSKKSLGVTLKGLKYTLNNEVLSNTFALGVSNSFAENCAEISVTNGTLLIMQEL